MPIFLIPDCISEKPVIRCTTQHDSMYAYAFLLAYAKEQGAQMRIWSCEFSGLTKRNTSILSLPCGTTSTHSKYEKYKTVHPYTVTSSLQVPARRPTDARPLNADYFLMSLPSEHVFASLTVHPNQGLWLLIFFVLSTKELTHQSSNEIGFHQRNKRGATDSRHVCTHRTLHTLWIQSCMITHVACTHTHTEAHAYIGTDATHTYQFAGRHTHTRVHIH